MGDFSEEEIEHCILDYLGTVKASHDSAKLPGSEPIVFRQPTAGLQFQQVRNKAVIYGLSCSSLRYFDSSRM